mmetsp:Transcript_149658/g.480492  ORF Transcript_149658/g.480492 Transcript_149658/m.480492 type:complete len:296 (+) Transcript_149658:2015-2902(+)
MCRTQDRRGRVQGLVHGPARLREPGDVLDLGPHAIQQVLRGLVQSRSIDHADLRRVHAVPGLPLGLVRQQGGPVVRTPLGRKGCVRVGVRAHEPLAHPTDEHRLVVVILHVADQGVVLEGDLRVEAVRFRVACLGEAHHAHLGLAREQLVQATLGGFKLACIHALLHRHIHGGGFVVHRALIRLQLRQVHLAHRPQHVEVLPQLVELKQVGRSSDILAVLAIQELDHSPIRVPHGHVVAHLQALQMLDQASLEVSGSGGLDCCVHETLATSHAMEEKLLRPNAGQESISDVATGA